MLHRQKLWCSVCVLLLHPREIGEGLYLLLRQSGSILPPTLAGAKCHNLTLHVTSSTSEMKSLLGWNTTALLQPMSYSIQQFTKESGENAIANEIVRQILGEQNVVVLP